MAHGLTNILLDPYQSSKWPYTYIRSLMIDGGLCQQNPARYTVGRVSAVWTRMYAKIEVTWRDKSRRYRGNSGSNNAHNLDRENIINDDDIGSNNTVTAINIEMGNKDGGGKEDKGDGNTATVVHGINN